MKRLYLLRHAKAGPAEAGGRDIDRTLLLSGVQAGGAMARYVSKCDYRPDLILCSASARTTQTAALVLQEVTAEIEYRDNLYLAPAARLIAAARAVPPHVSSLMIVGHNPGMEECAALLSREPARPRERGWVAALEEKFPTATLAVLDFDVGRWRDLREGGGELVDFVRPRDL